METRFLDSKEYPLWDMMVEASPCATIFDESRWFRSISKIIASPVKAVGVFDKERLVGGMILRPSRRFGLPIAILPPLSHTNTCVVVPREAASLAKNEHHVLDVTESIALFLQKNFYFATVTNNLTMYDIRSFRWLEWKTNVLYSYLIDLTSIDLMNLRQFRRRAINKARREGVIVTDENDPVTIHNLLYKTYQRQGIRLLLTLDQICQLCTGLAQDISVHIARHDKTKEALAVQVCALDRKRQTVYALLAGFDSDHRESQATSLLMWRCIEKFHQEGFLTFDLVGADVKSNVQFKSDFGGKLLPYYQVWYARSSYRLINLLSSVFKAKT